MTDGFNDEELIESLRLWNRDDAADRIEELVKERDEGMEEALSLAKSIHEKFYLKQAPQWEPLEDVAGVISQIDNMVAGIVEQLEAKLGEQNLLWQAYDGDLFQAYVDANEARIDAEAKLAGGVIAEYDDDSTVFLSGYAGGAAIGGAWSTLTLMEKASDGTLRVREYKAQGDWRATLAEIKLQSSEFATQKGESHE